MDYKNLSVCFTPAFFHVFGFKSDKIQSAKRLKRSFNSQKSEKDLEDTSVGHIFILTICELRKHLNEKPC